MEELLHRISALEEWCESKDVTIAKLQAQQKRMERTLEASAKRADDMLARIEAGEYAGTGDRILSDFSDCAIQSCKSQQQQ